MKKIIIAVIALIMSVTAVFFVGCDGEDKKYFEKVSSYSFWDNNGEEAVAQYKFYEVMDSFFSEGEIVDGSCIKDGKTRKILFVGMDGVRADALTNIFYDENDFDTNGYNYPCTDYSGINAVKSEGGLYIAYAGGEKGKDSEQETSTCAGWTSELTGAWHTIHGVDSNNDPKNTNKDTIMLKYAKLGLDTGLAFDWGQYFDVTLREEVSYLLANPETPMLLRDLDRPVAQSLQDIVKNEKLKDEEDILAKDIEHYNAVAMKNVGENAEYDVAMKDYLLERIEAGDDFVGGIFHAPDSNGHTYGFSNEDNHYVNSVRNSDAYIYTLFNTIKEREETMNEEWLIIVTADHGGSGKGHGKQIYEHRTIWVACNRKFDQSLFGKGYDGYREAE